MDCHREFNQNLLSIVDLAYYSKRDDSIIALQDKLRLVIRTSPETPLKEAQSTLWEYRNQIKDMDETFFMNFSDENINDTLNKVKDIFSQLSEPEKQIVWQSIKKMLSAVCQQKKKDKRV